MADLKPCPFAEGGETRIVVCDDEGNIHGDLGCEYEQDPWSGLSYGLIHIHEDDNCLIQQEYELLGRFTFDTAEEAIEAWNTRAERTCEMDDTTTGDEPLYEHYEHYYQCKECYGMFSIVRYQENGDTGCEMPRYCPDCGAKVISNEPR